jgi:hypothetical protein
MPATFARTTDRPRLFDDLPRRPRRAAPPARGRGPASPDRPPYRSDPALPGVEPAAREADPELPGVDRASRGAGPDAPTLEPAARDAEPAARDAEPAARDAEPAARDAEPAARAAEPATPGFDLTPADTELAPGGEQPASVGRSDHASTLDHLISNVWDELSAHRTVSCPVCHGHMAPRYGSAEQPVGGRCRRCGSTLG